jgi:hydrogenase nickel incorporation protein HypA/HybF
VHELSVCGAIADIATRHAGERDIEVIHVRIGQLRQVVPDTLVFCWSLVTADTPLHGSVLDVERVPAQLRCRGCGEQSDLSDSFTFVCADCGSFDVEVLSGEEFLVTAVDLAKV